MVFHQYNRHRPKHKLHNIPTFCCLFRLYCYIMQFVKFDSGVNRKTLPILVNLNWAELLGDNLPPWRPIRIIFSESALFSCPTSALFHELYLSYTQSYLAVHSASLFHLQVLQHLPSNVPNLETWGQDWRLFLVHVDRAMKNCFSQTALCLSLFRNFLACFVLRRNIKMIRFANQ